VQLYLEVREGPDYALEHGDPNIFDMLHVSGGMGRCERVGEGWRRELGKAGGREGVGREEGREEERMKGGGRRRSRVKGGGGKLREGERGRLWEAMKRLSVALSRV
jgi:hypothetical protein